MRLAETRPYAKERSLTIGARASGFATVTIRVRIVADELQLLYIYDKTDYENVNETFLRDVMRRME